MKESRIIHFSLVQNTCQKATALATFVVLMTWCKRPTLVSYHLEDRFRAPPIKKKIGLFVFFYSIVVLKCSFLLRVPCFLLAHNKILIEKYPNTHEKYWKIPETVQTLSEQQKYFLPVYFLMSPFSLCSSKHLVSRMLRRSGHAQRNQRKVSYLCCRTIIYLLFQFIFSK